MESIKRTNANIKDNEKHIAEEERRADDGGQRQRQQANLKALENTIADLEGECMEKNMTVSKLEEDIKTDDNRLRDLKKQLSDRRDNLMQAKNRLSELERSKKETLTVFHKNMPAALAAIKRQEQGFKEMPIGPLGVSVKIIKEEWAGILETLFGRNLNGFLVFHPEDRDKLRNILRQTGWYTPSTAH